MKKYYGMILLTGALSAAVFKDLCFGPFFGILAAVILGIPLFLLLCWFSKLLIKGHRKTIRWTALLITALFLIGLHWILFQPPGWLVFRRNLASPPPPSVEHIHAKWRYGGFDVPIHIRFEIDKTDLGKIILNKQYEKHDLEKDETADISGNAWFDITNMNDVEVYIRKSGKYQDDTSDYYLSEYIIYNPNTKQAFYSHFFWQ